MKTRILVIIFFAACLNVYSQNNKLSDAERFNLYIAKADSLISSKNYKQGIVYLDKALEIKVNEPKIFFKRGIAYFGLKEDQKAIDDFTKAIETDNKNAGAYYFRALAKFNMDSKDPRSPTEMTGSACVDLYHAKEMGYPLDFENYKEICPNL